MKLICVSKLYISCFPTKERMTKAKPCKMMKFIYTIIRRGFPKAWPPRNVYF